MINEKYKIIVIKKNVVNNIDYHTSKILVKIININRLYN